MMVAQSWLSPAQAAGRTPLSRKAIYGAIRRGELPAAKVTGRWLIAEDALQAWIAGGVRAENLAERARSQHGAARGRAPARGSLAALRAIEREESAA